MKVILDEMLPIGLRELLPAHDVVTAAYAGLAGIPNGELISRAIAQASVSSSRSTWASCTSRT